MTVESQQGIRFSIARHPYLAGRWTHLVPQSEARKAGWMATSDMPLGSWLSRSGAAHHARKITASGEFILSKGARN